MKLYCILKEAAKFCGIFIIIMTYFGTLLFISLWISKSVIQYVTGSVSNVSAIIWVALPILLVLFSLSFATFDCYMREKDKKKKKKAAAPAVSEQSQQS
jgi:intracellular septation protein A